MPTRVFKNTSKETINIAGVGEIPAGEQVSLTGENLPPVVVENYPGLVDVLAQEQIEADKKESVG